MNIALGTDSISGNDFFIDSTNHLNIEGMSGMGKSTLLVNLFIEHVRQGNGGLFILKTALEMRSEWPTASNKNGCKH
jgi:hypothetical protein